MRNCPICFKDDLKLIEIIHLSLVNDISLNNKLEIKQCIVCNFYFSDSNNNQNDYNLYYNNFNNYKHYQKYSNKDEKCYNFLKNELNDKNIINILDYGSGNGALKTLLSQDFIVDEFDIYMDKKTKKYDCLVLSHVLEHIYDLNNFIKLIKINIIEDGYLYIEVPNSSFYDKLIDITPLQELNIEHINFFSKIPLMKLLENNGFHTIMISDDYFTIKENKYYVIRGLFQLSNKTNILEKYIIQGKEIISKYNFNKLSTYKYIYVYGCGQFLYKILNNISQFTHIKNIIDDNTSLINKEINNIKILDFNKLVDNCLENDIILITSLIYDDLIKEKLKTINKSLIILTVQDLY
jgi:hypothetical protein